MVVQIIWLSDSQDASYLGPSMAPSPQSVTGDRLPGNKNRVETSVGTDGCPR